MSIGDFIGYFIGMMMIAFPFTGIVFGILCLILRGFGNSIGKYYIAGLLTIIFIILLRGLSQPMSQMFELTFFKAAIIVSSIIWTSLFLLISRIRGERDKPGIEANSLSIK